MKIVWTYFAVLSEQLQKTPGNTTKKNLSTDR